MKKELQLSGLRPVLIGFILEFVSFLFIGRAMNGLMNGSSFTAILVAALALISMVLIFWGLSSLGDASVFFNKAKKHVLIRIVIAALVMVCAALLSQKGNLTAGAMTNLPRGVLLEVTIGLLIAGVIWIVTVMMTGRHILRGCGHVAEQADDPVFSLKCMKTWRFWSLSILLMVLVFMASIAIILNVMAQTLKNGLEGQELYEAVVTNVASSALLASIIVIVASALFLIVHILFLLKIRHTYKEYHLEPVRIPEEDESNSVMAKYAAEIEDYAEAPELTIEAETEEDTVPTIEVESEEGEDA